MKTSLLLIFTIISSAFCYMSNGHRTISYAAYQSLSESRYNNGLCKFLKTKIDNQTLMEIIAESSPLPDMEPLADWEVNEGSSLSNYTFLKLTEQIPADIEVELQFVTKLFGFKLYEFSKKISYESTSTYEDFYKILLKWFASSVDFNDNIDALRAATQHTLVYDPQNTNSFETINGRYASLFVDNDYVSSVCPEAAQAEYYFAIKALNGKTFSSASITEKRNALIRLGRCLHYFQDITVPHHCEIVGNFKDLQIMANSSDAVINDPGAAEDITVSQNAYEGYYIDDRFYWDPEDQELIDLDTDKPYKPDNWQWDDVNKIYYKSGTGTYGALSFRSDMYDITIEDAIRSIRNYVFNNNYMDFCNGIQRYDVRNACVPTGPFTPLNIILSPECLVYKGYMHNPHYHEGCWQLDYDEETYYPCDVPEYNCTNFGFFFIDYYQWRELAGVDDNKDYVADQLVPLAIKSCAQVIAKFFNETDGIERDKDISSIISLLLLD